MNTRTLSEASAGGAGVSENALEEENMRLRTFRHPSFSTVFKLVREYYALGGSLHCVVGHTLGGKMELVTRYNDVIWLS